MTDDQEEINKEGYGAYLDNQKESSNPYSGLDAEYWSDGWEDAADDEKNRISASNQEYANAATPKFIAEQHSLQVSELPENFDILTESEARDLSEENRRKSIKIAEEEADPVVRASLLGQIDAYYST